MLVSFLRGNPPTVQNSSTPTCVLGFRVTQAGTGDPFAGLAAGQLALLRRVQVVRHREVADEERCVFLVDDHQRRSGVTPANLPWLTHALVTLLKDHSCNAF